VGDFGMDLKKWSQETSEMLNMIPNTDNNYLTAEIVHEIRNPLTTVKGFLQLIKPYLKEVGKEEYAEVALSELNRAHQLIDAYLQEKKAQSLPIQKSSLNMIVNEITLLYESDAILYGIQLTSNLSHQDVILNIPANKLKQVLINIINNAIEAIKESNALNKTITIATHTNDDKAEITITDGCGGITNETLDHLFTPYFSSKKAGTGIGLCICKKIIEEYEGNIHVESTPGKNTTFTISFNAKSFSKR
jgi:signal transduction histidine kinase